MQDRFKFRYVFKNKVYEVETIDFNEGYVYLKDEDDDNVNTRVKLDCENLLQSTGLKDKNGKLIYEGDIIVIPNMYPFFDYKNQEDKKENLTETQGEIRGESVLNYIGVVEWIHSKWQYVYHCVNPLKRGISEGINCELNEYSFKEGENTDFEVIGNIHENPELLKSEEK